MEGRAVPKQRTEPMLTCARAKTAELHTAHAHRCGNPKATPNPKLGGWDGHFVKLIITQGLCSFSNLEPEWPQGMDTP